MSNDKPPQWALAAAQSLNVNGLPDDHVASVIWEHYKARTLLLEKPQASATPGREAALLVHLEVERMVKAAGLPMIFVTISPEDMALVRSSYCLRGALNSAEREVIRMQANDYLEKLEEI